MQKQKKNYKKKVKNNFKFKKFFDKKQKTFFFLKRLLKEKSYTPNVLNFKSVFFKKPRQKKHLLTVTVKSNNIFCIFHNLSNNVILKKCSSGSYKINTSRKRLKFNINLILIPFLKEIQPFLKNKICFISVTSSIKIRKSILNIINESFSEKNVVLNLKNKKCFNGCRPAKKKRKKQKGQRFWK